MQDSSVTDQVDTSVIRRCWPWSIPWKTPLLTNRLRKTIRLAVEAGVGGVSGGKATEVRRISCKVGAIHPVERDRSTGRGTIEVRVECTDAWTTSATVNYGHRTNARRPENTLASCTANTDNTTAIFCHQLSVNLKNFLHFPSYIYFT